MTTLQAARVYGVPRSSLQRRVWGKCNVKVALGPRKQVFTPAQEIRLKEHILKMEKMFFGLTPKDVRSLAFQYAEINKFPHGLKNGIAGMDWLQGFLSRHKDLALRTPEATSAARAKGFNKQMVSKFFDILEKVSKNVKGPHAVYNVDETGITTVQSKPNRIFARRGKKQVGSVTSAERGELTTAVVCMSAVGNFVPPMMILPRTKENQNLEEGAPPGTVFVYHRSGWMQTDIFTRWFQHFLRHAKPSAEEPVLLILNGHLTLTHTRNLDLIELARDNHVTIVVIPPHTSHRLQPLDVGFMKPLSTFYSFYSYSSTSTACTLRLSRSSSGKIQAEWSLSTRWRAYSVRHTSGLRHHLQLSTPSGNAAYVYPTDRDVFAEEDYTPSEVTDVSCPESQAAGASTSG
ncbi:MFS-type transporter clz9-like [Amphibalanus amphitrite]|uniref:MFS-type transporter clz9-like n=1 Tax=Amphibalanus amphitrite TaxID=1232801 RepID=UPI001C912A3C|nr:MFS-type transporter clz9-like [Amphibalanus amphitrite]